MAAEENDFLTTVGRDVARRALEVEIPNNYGEPRTLRKYLRDLLWELWNTTADFSGKRPFGDSGWEFDIYTELVKAGFVEGDLVEGLIDTTAADRIVFAAIELIFEESA